MLVTAAAWGVVSGLLSLESAGCLSPVLHYVISVPPTFVPF